MMDIFKERYNALEIGPRVDPLLPKISYSLLPSRSRLVFLDKEVQTPHLQEHLDQGMNDTYSVRTNRLKDFIIEGDTTALPFPDKSFDLIMARDVFGAQDKHLPNMYTKRNKGKKENVGDVFQIAFEWSRVLKNGGSALILEWSTPVDQNELLNAFSVAGLELVDILDGSRFVEIFEFSNERERVVSHRVFEEMYSDRTGAYILILKKNE